MTLEAEHPPEAWTDERFVGEEFPLDEYATAEHLVEREMQVDRGLSRYRELVEFLKPVWLAKIEFDRRVAARTVAIFVSGTYPDMNAPAPFCAAGEPRKVTRTDAAALAEAEVTFTWEGPIPSVVIESVRQQIHMLQYHLNGRGGQTSAVQTLLNSQGRAAHGGGR